MNQPWQIDEGLKLIRALQDRVKAFGYHIALGGGVLNNGVSDKDLDLYFLPFNNPDVAKEDAPGLLEWLSKLWGEPRTIGDYPDQLDPGPEPEFEDGPLAPPQPVLRRPQFARVARDWSPASLGGVPISDSGLTEPASAQAIQWARDLAPARSNKKRDSSYKYKLKFERAGNDRIDVFII